MLVFVFDYMANKRIIFGYQLILWAKTYVFSCFLLKKGRISTYSQVWDSILLLLAVILSVKVEHQINGLVQFPSTLKNILV
jgi:hypothetical protein